MDHPEGFGEEVLLFHPRLLCLALTLSVTAQQLPGPF
jgi:hypothetical protein